MKSKKQLGYNRRADKLSEPSRNTKKNKSTIRETKRNYHQKTQSRSIHIKRSPTLWTGIRESVATFYKRLKKYGIGFLKVLSKRETIRTIGEVIALFRISSGPHNA